MWKTKNNRPMEKDKAFARFRSYGYEPIDDCYKNSLDKINCYDSEGYKVKISLGSLGRVKQYQRFSVTSNEENFIHNARLHGRKNNFNSKILKWTKSKIKNHIDVVCLCSCGNEFVVDFNDWRRGTKTRCNACTAKMSNIEKQVKDYLEDIHIEFEMQKRFDDCRNKRPLPFDFYIPSLNLCIEVDGEQHYYPNILHNQKYGFDRLKLHDSIKTKYCESKNINFLRISFRDVRNGKYKEIINKKINIC